MNVCLNVSRLFIAYNDNLVPLLYIGFVACRFSYDKFIFRWINNDNYSSNNNNKYGNRSTSLEMSGGTFFSCHLVLENRHPDFTEKFI